MGSCLRARGRKILRSVLLKLFSRCLVFIDFRMFQTLSGRRPLTTKQLWDFSVPLSREDVSLAESAERWSLGWLSQTGLNTAV